METTQYSPCVALFCIYVLSTWLLQFSGPNPSSSARAECCSLPSYICVRKHECQPHFPIIMLAPICFRTQLKTPCFYLKLYLTICILAQRCCLVFFLKTKYKERKEFCWNTLVDIKSWSHCVLYASGKNSAWLIYFRKLLWSKCISAAGNNCNFPFVHYLHQENES